MKIIYILRSGIGIVNDGGSTEIKYAVTSLLSLREDDTEYTNKARITSISIDELTTLRSNFVWGINLRDETTFIIIPNLGGDKNSIYWVSGAVGLIVIVIGIILLKKKVLE